MNLLNRLPSTEGYEKKELLRLLLQEEYGHLPPLPSRITVVEERRDSNSFGGKARFWHLRLRCEADFGVFEFPVQLVCPRNATSPVPAFLHVNFRDLIPDQYQPTEEIIDRGHALLTLCYTDVTSDDGDFSNGLAGVVYPNGTRDAHACGKIGLWTWAALCTLEYALTRAELDPHRISVVGHSRLGKTALLAGALDERFFCAFSNDSGCCGAALARENGGETVEKICATFPYWFSTHFHAYAGREEELPFDQHFLLAANFPHRVYVASAAADLWACPKNEHLSAVAASAFYERQGLCGLPSPSLELPAVGTALHTGHVGYHLREGSHYLSRTDWNFYIDYLEAAYQRDGVL